MSATTTSTKDDIAKMGVGQGELYSPDHAIKLTKQEEEVEEEEERRRLEKMALMGSVAADIRRNLGTIKDRVMEKLATASVPPDSVENALHFIESVIRDVTVATHGLTKDALLRIKTHLSDLIPSLSPNITTKMVDDAEKEANIEQREGSSGTTDYGEEEKRDGVHHHHQGKNNNKQDGRSSKGGTPFMSPTSSLFTSFIVKAQSRL